MAKVFISYVTEDRWIATQIAAGVAHAGASYFMFEKGIESGQVISERIRDEMDTATEHVILITQAAITHPYMWLEVGQSFQRRIPITVVVHGMSVHDFLTLPDTPGFLHDRNVRHLNDVDRYLDELGRRG
jgi:hypothetical protein